MATELLLNEAMMRLLSKMGSYETYDNWKVSKALGHCLDGHAEKDEVEWIDEVLAESKPALTGLRAGA